MKSLGITVLGSGSRGNSILLHSADEGILVDAGFSRKEIVARIRKSNISPKIIKAILISHEHGDHISGAKVLADSFGIPTYGTSETLKHLHIYGKLGRDVKVSRADPTSASGPSGSGHSPFRTMPRTLSASS